MAKGKWTKQMWTDAALRAIARGGVAAVAVDTLATELGATRGSFYWHFKDRRALLEEAMRVWEEQETDRVERTLQAIADPEERMRAGFRIALDDLDGPNPNLEPAIYAQADDPVVAEAIRRVSTRRLDILARGYLALGLTDEKARLQAVLSYAAYLGWLQLRRITSPDIPEVDANAPQHRALVDHVIEQLVPAARREAASP